MKRLLNWLFFPTQAWGDYSMKRELRNDETRRRIRELPPLPEEAAIQQARLLARNADEFEKLLRGDK